MPLIRAEFSEQELGLIKAMCQREAGLYLEPVSFHVQHAATDDLIQSVLDKTTVLLTPFKKPVGRVRARHDA